MRVGWLKDEHGKESASLTFLTLFCFAALAMWILSVLGHTAREVTSGDVSFVAGTGIALYGYRKFQKEGLTGGKIVPRGTSVGTEETKE